MFAARFQQGDLTAVTDQSLAALLSELAPAVGIRVAADGSVVELTGDILREFGFDPAALQGRMVSDPIFPPGMAELVEQAFRGEVGISPLVTYFGRPWRMFVRPVMDEAGAVTAVVGAMVLSPTDGADIASSDADEQRLADIGRLALTPELSSMAQAAVSLVIERLGMRSCHILRESEDGSHLIRFASAGEVVCPDKMLVDSHTVAGQSLLSNSIVRRAAADLPVPDPVDPGGEDFIAHPLGGPAGTWGVMKAVAGTRTSTSDREFLTMVAWALSTAVARSDLEERLRHQALHDPMTGLPNRRLMSDRLAQSIARSHQDSTLTAGLLLDIDDFKAVNDTLGHTAGDEFLMAVARRLQTALRPGDSVSRAGGDEFVILAEGLESEYQVIPIAERILGTLAQPLQVAGHEVHASASIGIAVSSSEHHDVATLLGEADMAMYQAKKSEVGSYRFYDEGMRRGVVNRLNIAGELRRALADDEITIAYQPIMSLRTGEIRSVEALARWTTKAGDVIPPDVFIPVAEASGVIHDLGTYVCAGHWR